VKRADLIRAVAELGCEPNWDGSRKHDWYRNPNTGVSQAVPRHREISEHLARHVLQMLANDPPKKPK
jgi:hypothetical protein